MQGNKYYPLIMELQDLTFQLSGLISKYSSSEPERNYQKYKIKFTEDTNSGGPFAAFTGVVFLSSKPFSLLLILFIFIAHAYHSNFNFLCFKHKSIV